MIRFAAFGSPKFWKYMGQLNEGATNADEVIPEKDWAMVASTFEQLVEVLAKATGRADDLADYIIFGIICHGGLKEYVRALRYVQDGGDLEEEFENYEDEACFSAIMQLGDVAEHTSIKKKGRGSYIRYTFEQSSSYEKIERFVDLVYSKMPSDLQQGIVDVKLTNLSRSSDDYTAYFFHSFKGSQELALFRWMDSIRGSVSRQLKIARPFLIGSWQED